MALVKAYYNDNDKFCVSWLRELIKAGLIADGDVDDRSIWDIVPSDLKDYTQCHFFAGIGGWSYALRLSGWPDEHPVWSGSCPCQPFSSAGKGKGITDERHLWPAWFHLIRECNPTTVFGEQVEAAIRSGWLDLISADLEEENYTIASSVLTAAGVGAPHERSRLYFVADSKLRATERQRFIMESAANHSQGIKEKRERLRVDISNGSKPSIMDNSTSPRQPSARGRQSAEPEGREFRSSMGREVGELGKADSTRVSRYRSEYKLQEIGRQSSSVRSSPFDAPNSTNNFWQDADWLFCTDGYWRCVEPSTFPLANGISARVGRISGYGNSIVPHVAASFIKAFLEATS